MARGRVFTWGQAPDQVTPGWLGLTCVLDADGKLAIWSRLGLRCDIDKVIIAGPGALSSARISSPGEIQPGKGGHTHSSPDLQCAVMPRGVAG